MRIVSARAGTVILRVDSPTQIHVSANFTRTGGFAFTLGVKASGNTASGSNFITGITSTAGFQAGWTISGDAIPAGTTISRVTSATITAGNFPVTVLGAALVSSEQCQVNVQLPLDIPAGNDPLTMTVPNGSTQTSGVAVRLLVGP